MVKPDQGLGWPQWEARRFCSKACLGESYRRQKVPCAHCGETFHPIITRRTVFCSRTCYHGFRLGKTKSPQWRLATARKRAALGQNFTPSQKKALIERSGGRCESCGATEDLECDHIVPCHLGGTNDLSNGQVLCSECHQRKTLEQRPRAA